MASDTRTRLVEAATRRFYRDGFRNVGIEEILDDVRISKTAFYKHFSCKEELMREVLETQSLWLQDRFKQMIRDQGGRAAADQLRGLFDVVERVIESDDFHGCIFINVSMEFPLAHDPAHKLAAQNKQAIEDIIFELAERAGAAAPDRLAQELCLIIEGTYVSRQVTGRRETIATARRLAERAIQAHLGA
jgi:AcrR family transcriptional regulator